MIKLGTKSRQNDLYQEVELEYPNGNKEVCWIPEELAINEKLVHFKKDNFNAKVIKVYSTKRRLYEIEINKMHPLKEATDI